MNKNYDFLIVGAGPAGMFAAYEIAKSKTKKGQKILLIDLGEKIENRKPSQVMSGVGGAGTFSDGKIHFSPTLSHEKAFHLIDIKDYQVILDYVDEILTDLGVDSEYFPKDTNEVRKLIEEAQKNDIVFL